MSRKFVKITQYELSQKINSWLFRLNGFYSLIEYLKKDLKVKFDLENYGYISTEEKDLMGIRTIGNLTFCGMYGGGDWESPVYFIVYWDGKRLRGYVPTKGNPYNTDTMEAYGNDEVADTKNVRKRYPEHFDTIPEDYMVDSSDFNWDSELIIQDIKERLIEKV